jgi:hypothetical protein
LRVKFYPRALMGDLILKELIETIFGYVCDQYELKFFRKRK